MATVRAGSARARIRAKLHQVGKPLPLMEALVSAYGGSVLDPFTGSGTTDAAVLRQGKDFVGIWASEHYCQVAAARLLKLAAPTRDG